MGHFYFVRHGQTEKNKEKVLQGRSNPPLNDKGREQAGILGDAFKRNGIFFDKVYSSPLLRAVETARMIAGENAEIIMDARLLEMDYGPYEGVSLENPPQEVITFFSDFVNHPAPEGMEPLDSVVRRVGSFIEELKSCTEKNILIVTHAIALKGALEYVTPDSHGAYWSQYIGNCEVYEGRFFCPEECHCVLRSVTGPLSKFRTVIL